MAKGFTDIAIRNLSTRLRCAVIFRWRDALACTWSCNRRARSRGPFATATTARRAS